MIHCVKLERVGRSVQVRVYGSKDKFPQGFTCIEQVPYRPGHEDVKKSTMDSLIKRGRRSAKDLKVDFVNLT